MTKKELHLLIEGIEWRRTDYIQPHEYILQDGHPELFAELVEALENDKEVYSGTFKGWTYQYLVIGNYKYWRIEDVLNRALVFSR